MGNNIGMEVNGLANDFHNVLQAANVLFGKDADSIVETVAEKCETDYIKLRDILRDKGHEPTQIRMDFLMACGMASCAIVEARESLQAALKWGAYEG